jgi:hypothetical protein
MQITTIGLDLAKSVFVHGIDATGQVVVRKSLRRSQMLHFAPSCPLAWSAWWLAARRIIGRASLKGARPGHRAARLFDHLVSPSERRRGTSGTLRLSGR